MKGEIDIAAFVGLGIWLWVLFALLLTEAILGLSAFEGQF